MVMMVPRAFFLVVVLAAPLTSGCDQFVHGQMFRIQNDSRQDLTLRSADQTFKRKWKCLVPAGETRSMSVGFTLTIHDDGKLWSYDLARVTRPDRVILIECSDGGWALPEMDEVAIKPDGTLEISRLTGQHAEEHPIGQVPR
jgi:hypothetical protein